MIFLNFIGAVNLLTPFVVRSVLCRHSTGTAGLCCREMPFICVPFFYFQNGDGISALQQKELNIQEVLFNEMAKFALVLMDSR